ncbi:DUF998 domain-containing protein [Promethearchaeum syntrophicum]|uniref:DUF998 domain-containing protein n=1 Tax=Promethearchaeum syntrophicum TaxID=2594042 RepID=A0A5B9D626_9ARCH|nr:DUF998 domain-containing protein [Candidatus Prometheoarchaeum syntrophicum]QEE14436.1 hypothetical protein DSAG12_00249 [Candidatus Prometheoarchaeum syntrophicum]
MDTLRYKIQNTKELLLSRLSFSNAENDIFQRFVYLRVPLEVMKGKASKNQTRNYFFFVLAIFFVISVYAQIVFPEPYSIFRNTISDQGGIMLNPIGHKLWNFGIVLLGILSIPHFLYLYHILKSLSIIYSTLSTALGILCSLSMSFVGIFPQDFEVPHGIFASICFLGSFIKANSDLILYIIEKRKQKGEEYTLKVPKYILIGAFYVLFNVSFLMMMGTYFIDMKLVPFWEWAYFLSILVWILGTYIIK